MDINATPIEFKIVKIGSITLIRIHQFSDENHKLNPWPSRSIWCDQYRV